MMNIQIKRGTSLALAALNPVLAAGEPCLETDTNKVKYGNGVDPWNNLDYINPNIVNIDGNDPYIPPSGVPTSFNPSSISGLSMWFESADSDNGVISNQRLVSWLNKQDNRYANQTRFSLRPKVINTAKNKYVLSFDGQDDRLLGAAELNQNLTAFVVFKTNSSSKNKTLVSTDSLKLCSFDNDGRIGTSIGNNHYSAESIVTDAELVLNFNESPIVDSAKNGTITTYGNVQILNGKFGKAAYLDGSSYIEVPAQNFGTGDFTIELWVKPTTTPATPWTTILTTGSGQVFEEIRIGQNINGGGTGVLFRNNTNNAHRISNGTTMPINSWNHVALVREGTVMRYYLNGKLLHTFSNVSISHTATSPTRIGYGYYPWDGYFTGYIDGVRIIKKAIYSGDYFSLPTKQPAPFHGPSIVNEEPSLYSCEITGTNIVTKINGVTSYSGSIPEIQNTTRFAIGSSMNGDQVFDGDIAAVVVYNKSLTPVEYNQVKSYLHLRWTDELGLLNRLKAFWPLNEINGPRLDVSDNAKVLTVGEATGYSQDVPSSSSSIASTFASNVSITPVDFNITNLAYGNGIYVGINNASTGTSYRTSTNGTTWTSRTLPLSKNWLNVKYVNDRFIIVGNSEVALTSTDGISWNQVNIQNMAPSPVNASLLLNFNGANNATTTTDSSPNNYAVTLYNGAKLSNVQSKFGGTSLALTRSGSQYASVTSTNLTTPLFTSDFTMECWFRATSDGGTSCLMTTRHDFSWGGKIFCICAGRLYGDNWRGPTIWCGAWDSWWRSVINGPAFDLNTWYHVAMTVRTDGTMQLFVNGNLVSTTGGATLDSNRPISDNLYIGRRWDNVDGANQYFDGYIEDAKITYGVLYNNSFTAPTSQAVVSGNAIPSTKSWRSVAYGNNTYVAITNSDKFAYSSDASSWTNISSPANVQWSDIAFGNNIFVAGAGNSIKKAVSSNGTSWTTSDAGDSSKKITYGNGKFVSLRNVTNTTGLSTHSSTDGITWTPNGVSGNGRQGTSLIYTDNKFLKIPYSSSSIDYSLDGTDWQTISILDTNSQCVDIVSDNNGKFTMTGGQTSNGNIMVNFNIGSSTLNSTAALFEGLEYLETDITTAAESFAVWIKIPPTSVTNRTAMEILGQWDGAEGSWRLVYDHSNGGLAVDVGNTRVSLGVSGNTIADNTWQLVAGTYDNNVYKLYSLRPNGETIATATILLTGLLNGYNLRVGSLSLNPASSFIGQLDNLGLWDRGLTEAEVRKLYKNGTSSNTL